MTSEVPSTSPLLGCSPIGLIAWLEVPGRPLHLGASWLAQHTGHPEGGPPLGLDALLAPESRERLQRALATDHSGAEACVDVGVLALPNSDGQQIWLHLSAQRRATPQGPAEFLATAIDVTAAKRLERQLAEKSTRLELVLEGTRLGMWDWNPVTNEVQFNERWAEMLGYELGEIRPALHEWQSRVHPDDLAACFEDIRAHVEGRSPFYENVHRMRHRDGSWRFILDRGKIVERDEAGRPIRFTGTHTDITAQKQAELRALEAAQEKSLFLATMSHEIRTPLNGILGLLQVLEGTHLDERQQELVKLVMESGEHLLVIINDILDFSKVEAGQLRIDPHPFDLTALVRSVANLYAERAAEKGLDLVVDARDRASGSFLGDSHRLHQVLGNLVSNAIKFTAKGHVTLVVDRRGSPDGGELVLQVVDSGKGIQDVTTIFERFRQEHASIARTHGGTGLGLAISRALVELMGGTLTVASELGVGSTFTVRLPARPAAAPTTAPARVQPATDLRGLRVLVAEDNPVNRRVAQGMLARAGVTPSFAVDGEEAVAQCVAAPFDVVLMDIHMPRMDGVAATRELVTRLGARRPRVVALSADVLDANRAECLAAGFDAFLAKPFRFEELVALLEGLAPRADAA